MLDWEVAIRVWIMVLSLHMLDFVRWGNSMQKVEFQLALVLLSDAPWHWHWHWQQHVGKGSKHVFNEWSEYSQFTQPTLFLTSLVRTIQERQSFNCGNKLWRFLVSSFSNLGRRKSIS